MARIHARRNGIAGSTKPVNPDYSFVTLKKDQIEKIIVDLGKEDVSASKIGLILRDSHTVPNVKLIIGKSIGDVLKENNLSKKVPEDITFLVSKFNRLKKHLESNSRDTHNTRSLSLIEHKIKRLLKYYKREGKVDANWSYK